MLACMLIVLVGCRFASKEVYKTVLLLLHGQNLSYASSRDLSAEAVLSTDAGRHRRRRWRLNLSTSIGRAWQALLSTLPS